LRQTESAPGEYPLTGEDYLDWRAQSTTFSEMSLYSWPIGMNASGAGVPEAVSVIATQANFFQLLAVPPQLGRLFADGEDRKGADRVVLLSAGFWKAHFGGRADALGKTLELNAEPYTIIGVLPVWYHGTGDADLWVPQDMSLETLGKRGQHSWRAIGRMKEGATLEQVRADLRTIAERLEKQFPNTNRNVDAVVIPMREWLVGGSRSQLWIMFGAVGLVLLIACANVANLLLARSTGRRREIAVRVALGAGRSRLLRQLLTESLLMSVVGGAIGVGVAYAGVSALRGVLPDILPQPNPVTVGFVPLAFTFLTCVAAGIFFGLAPAVQSSSVRSNEALKSKGSLHAVASRQGNWLRNALVAGEIALSLALLTGAGLLLRTFENLRKTNLGIQPEHVLTAEIRLPGTSYKTNEQDWRFFDLLLQKLSGAPGVRAAAMTTKLPLRGGQNGYITIPGKQTESQSGSLVEFSAVTPSYFHVMGIPLLAGREFTSEDLESSITFMRDVVPLLVKGDIEAVKAATKKQMFPSIINETMARTFWPKEDVLGKTYQNFATFRVIGVVGDVNQGNLRGATMPEAYNTLVSDPTGYVVLLSSVAPENMIGTLRATMGSMDKSLALFHVRSMPQIISESMTTTRYETVLLLSMATLALLLAAVGTYGVMSFVVGQRTNEIGIRMALGARPKEILIMVLRQALGLVAVGIAAGWLGAAGGARLMQSLLFRVAPFDLVTYGSVSAMLAAVALLACWIPVRRAMRVDPMVALRYE
jgi:predicted permease